MTPLHVAAERGGRLSIIEHLSEKGVDINFKDNKGVNQFDYVTKSVLLI